MSFKSRTGYLQIAALKIDPNNKQFNAVNPPALLPKITTFSLSTRFNLINSRASALQS